MMKQNIIKAPTWFWVISIILFLWMLMGIWSFVEHVFISDEKLMSLPENERELYGKYSLWTQIVFAIATVGGFLAAIFLLLRNQLAKPLFLISLIAVIIQMAHSLFIAKAPEVYGNSAYFMPLLIVAVGYFAYWIANHSKKLGIIN